MTVKIKDFIVMFQEISQYFLWYMSYLISNLLPVWIKSQDVLVHHPQSLLERFFKLPANRHYLSNAFHGTSNLQRDITLNFPSACAYFKA